MTTDFFKGASPESFSFQIPEFRFQNSDFINQKSVNEIICENLFYQCHLCAI